MVCLIGIDGSGKTAHAQSILLDLQKSGVKCKYVWFGNAYFLSYPFMAFCRVLSLTDTHRVANEATCSEHQYYKNKAVALLWPWVQVMDLVFFTILRVYLPLWRNFTVVCDRFVQDILVEIMADVDDNQLHKKLVGLPILRLKPRSAMVFLLDVNEAIALRRKHDVPNLRYLTRRRNNYRLISRDLKIPIVRAQGSFGCVHKQLVGMIHGLKSE